MENWSRKNSRRNLEKIAVGAQLGSPNFKSEAGQINQKAIIKFDRTLITQILIFFFFPTVDQTFTTRLNNEPERT